MPYYLFFIFVVDAVALYYTDEVMRISVLLLLW